MKQNETKSARAESTHKGIHFPLATQVFVVVLVLHILSADWLPCVLKLTPLCVDSWSSQFVYLDLMATLLW